jgi:predicted nuclease of predicted toxin-antitoxin system
MIKLLANENFPYTSIKVLRNAGFDVLAIGEKYTGIRDHEVMEIAVKEERTIVTFDRDYGELVFKYGFRPHKGIIYFRWNDFTPDEPAFYLLDLFNQSMININSCLTVIDKNTVRQRKY